MAGDNAALSERFYKYFPTTTFIKASSSDMSKWAKSQLAETSPNSDTKLNPSVFDPSYPAAELVASTPGDRSARLNLIPDWIKKNPSAFPFPT